MIIYKITNLINNKFYIGQDIKDDPKYFGSGKLIQMAIKKYGKENFIKETLEICTDEKQMDEREIFWIKELNATNRKIAYNICEGGKTFRTMKGENNYWFGKHHSEESKAIIREKRKLQKMSEEQKQRLREKWLGEENPGKHKSKETIEKIKESLSKIDRTGVNSSMSGKTHSEETKKHWSEIRKGKNTGITNPDATRYFVETPNGEELMFNTRKEVIEYLGCSLGFLSVGSFNGYKLIRKEKINNNNIIKPNIYSIIYYVLTPEGEELKFNSRKEIMENLGCSLNFFTSKKFRGFKLIKKEKIK